MVPLQTVIPPLHTICCAIGTTSETTGNLGTVLETVSRGAVVDPRGGCPCSLYGNSTRHSLVKHRGQTSKMPGHRGSLHSTKTSAPLKTGGAKAGLQGDSARSSHIARDSGETLDQFVFQLQINTQYTSPVCLDRMI